jgi:CheY-like chemotaxis protein
MGFSIHAVANGVEAVQKLSSADYDLVLMDCQMPEMDGYEACRKIRNGPSEVRNPKIPIIAMTAHVMNGDREKCLDAGMNDYITKPVDPLALGRLIDQWLFQTPSSSHGDKMEGIPTPHETPSSPEWGPVKPIVFEKEAMMNRLMGDQDLFRYVAGVFIKNMPKMIEALNGYLSDADLQNTHRQIHTIKGATSNVSANRMVQAAMHMEKIAKSGDLDGVRRVFPRLQHEFNQIKAILEQELLSESLH